MGEFDFVFGVLESQGFELSFQKVAIKPGKPTVFGRNGATWVFGLPGNPVSTFLIFEIFVKPFCYKLMGSDYNATKVMGVLSETVKTKGSNRITNIPVILHSDGKVEAVDYHGSAHIHAFAVSNGYISIPIGVNEVGGGEEVQVTLIS